MKLTAILLFTMCIGVCLGADFPAGVPTEYLGLLITSSIDLNINPNIDINHPAIKALPHYDYLVEPIVIGLYGSGLANICVNEAFSPPYTFISAFYGSSWHKANPFTELPCDDIVLDQVDFDAGSEVILLICRNDPFMQAIIDSFTAVYNDSEPRTVSVSWTTSSETGLSSFKLYRNHTNDPVTAAYIHLQPATNTDQAHTYTFEDGSPWIGFTNYYWLMIVDNLDQGYFYGPVSVQVGEPHVPQNSVQSVIPNPCDDRFWFSYELQDSSFVSILLLDANNTVVKEIRHKESMASGWHMSSILVSDLPEGLYRIYYWFEQSGGPFYAYGDVLIERE